MSKPAQEMWFSQTIQSYKPCWLSWVVIFMKHILSVMTSYCWISPIKLRQRPDITTAVDRDLKHQFKQTNKARVAAWEYGPPDGPADY